MDESADHAAEAEETTAIPVPDKVFDAMRRCTAGVEESQKDGNGKYMLTTTASPRSARRSSSTTSGWCCSGTSAFPSDSTCKGSIGAKSRATTYRGAQG